MAAKSEFTIKVEMQERWVPHFLAMLRYMEYLGNVGSSRQVSFFSDGDGDFQPKFEWNIEVELTNPIREFNGDRDYDAG